MTGWIGKVMYPALEDLQTINDTVLELREANAKLQRMYKEIIQSQRDEIDDLRNRLIANYEALDSMTLAIEQQGSAALIRRATRILQEREKAINVPGSQDYMD